MSIVVQLLIPGDGARQRKHAPVGNGADHTALAQDKLAGGLDDTVDSMVLVISSSGRGGGSSGSLSSVRKSEGQEGGLCILSHLGEVAGPDLQELASVWEFNGDGLSR